jgi:hypothetical protein
LFLWQWGEDPFFSGSVLFIDEAGFTRNSIINFHNTHLEWQTHTVQFSPDI